MANIILKIKNGDTYILKVDKDIISKEDKGILESIASAAFEDNETFYEMSNMDIALLYKEEIEKSLVCKVEFLSIDLEVEIRE